MSNQLPMLPPEREEPKQIFPSEKLTKDRKAVFDALSAGGPMCDAQIFLALSESGYRISPSSCRTRRNELVELGLVEFTDAFQRLPTGRKSRIWKVSHRLGKNQ